MENALNERLIYLIEYRLTQEARRDGKWKNGLIRKYARKARAAIMGGKLRFALRGELDEEIIDKIVQWAASAGHC